MLLIEEIIAPIVSRHLRPLDIEFSIWVSQNGICLIMTRQCDLHQLCWPEIVKVGVVILFLLLDRDQSVSHFDKILR